MRVHISGLFLLSGCATYITKPIDDTADTAAVGTDTETDPDTGIDTEDSDTDDSDTDDSDTGDSDTGDSDTGDSDTDEPEPDPLELPAELLDLSNWKLTLPTGDEGSPDEITQPELDTFSVDPYFMLNDDASAVVFRADVDGVTTSGSGYPRSELREMDGTSKAAWSTTSGRHTMTITQAITHRPRCNRHRSSSTTAHISQHRYKNLNVLCCHCRVDHHISSEVELQEGIVRDTGCSAGVT